MYGAMQSELYLPFLVFSCQAGRDCQVIAKSRAKDVMFKKREANARLINQTQCPTFTCPSHSTMLYLVSFIYEP